MRLTATDEKLLATIAELHGTPSGAFNIRRNGELLARSATAEIKIETKKDKPGINVYVAPGTRGKSVHIPVLLTVSGMRDLVYNTFDIGEGADVLVVAGCGIHNPGNEAAQHDGVHEFFLRRGARMRYVERHYGEGPGRGARILNPKTVLTLEPGAQAELELVQIRGVDSTVRETEAYVGAGAHLVVRESVLTGGSQQAESLVVVELTGSGGSAEVLARSVAQDRSRQVFRARLTGRARARGHIACDSLIMDQAEISSLPELHAACSEAELTHEAAIGRIAGEQLLKLMTLGLSEEEAVETILAGFLGVSRALLAARKE